MLLQKKSNGGGSNYTNDHTCTDHRAHVVTVSTYLFLSCVHTLDTEGHVTTNNGLGRFKRYWVTANTNESVASYLRNIGTL